ncbi:OsmC family protein [Nesterenkonia xinjiangensis]|uniref:Organic hydroperoxide reductase OsmC/OhrA n=1 Tax=Nesterenkonia xinjiangensis TaxID=225327 RepID=A0A7Z0K9G3_9MICC|nr:OsmC family protein [Nesterenkonia xinjiangensis]NYJ78651.1 organic hydroperoxide reductase OsmC/OhrA [Nesterenkonia xinjiangensis]
MSTPATQHLDDDGARPLYSAAVVNIGGTSGRVWAEGGPSLPTASPFDTDRPTGSNGSSEVGADPEQLLGMAWSTCLNATLEVVLAEAGIEARCTVRVDVDLHREPSGAGYRFVPRAVAAVEGMSPDQARPHVAAAHARCPVSKLLTGVPGAPAHPPVQVAEFSAPAPR